MPCKLTVHGSRYQLIHWIIIRDLSLDREVQTPTVSSFHSEVGLGIIGRVVETVAGSMEQQRRVLLCILLLGTIAESSLSTPVLAKKPEQLEVAKNEYYSWIDRVSRKYAQLPNSTLVDTSYAEDVSEVVTIVVDQSGKGNFKTVRKAIASIPDGSVTRYVIFVNAGVYKEKVTIPSKKGPITLQGAGYRQTYITYDQDAAEAGSTFLSASVSVKSDGFIAKDIAFENTSPSPPPGAVGRQAVAFSISGDAAAFYRVAFLGYQDTLYDKKGRHYFKDCYIRGSIDFIFGDGLSLYESCYLDSVATTFGSVAAQKRISKADDTGFSFVNCTLNGSGYIYLSRAWGAYSRVVFIRSYFDKAVRPEGWSDWDVPGRYKTVYYGEYQCYGPGASRQGRVFWSFELTAAQAAPFMTIDWIQGKKWLPSGNQ